MPAFVDFKCKKCNHVYELMLSKISAVDEESKAEKCPKCGSKSKTKVPSFGQGFILKGSGWHSKDYKK